MHFMSSLGHSSAIWAHRAQAQKIMRSHDAKGSLPMDMLSLGVIHLDLSISPDYYSLAVESCLAIGYDSFAPPLA